MSSRFQKKHLYFHQIILNITKILLAITPINICKPLIQNLLDINHSLSAALLSDAHWGNYKLKITWRIVHGHYYNHFIRFINPVNHGIILNH